MAFPAEALIDTFDIISQAVRTWLASIAGKFARGDDQPNHSLSTIRVDFTYLVEFGRSSAFDPEDTVHPSHKFVPIRHESIAMGVRSPFCSPQASPSCSWTKTVVYAPEDQANKSDLAVMIWFQGGALIPNINPENMEPVS